MVHEFEKNALKTVHYAKPEISIIRLDIGFCENSNISTHTIEKAGSSTSLLSPFPIIEILDEPVSQPIFSLLVCGGKNTS